MSKMAVLKYKARVNLCVLVFLVLSGLSEAVVKARNELGDSKLTYSLFKEASPVMNRLGTEFSFPRSKREEGSAAACATGGNVDKLDYNIYNLQSGDTLEVHDTIKPIWVQDALIVVTEDRSNGSHLIRVAVDTDNNVVFNDLTHYIEGQTASAGSIRLSTADVADVFIVSKDQTKLFVSVDGGLTWSTHPLPSASFDRVYDFLLHPSRAGHLMLRSSDGELRVSHNYGQTWTTEVTGVLIADWDADYSAKTVGKVFYMTADATSDRYSHTLFSNDPEHFDEERMIDEHVFKFVVDGRYIFWTKQNSSDPKNVTRQMYSSAYRGDRVHQVHLPSVSAADSYVVMGSHDAGAFIHLRLASKSGMCTDNGSLYTSDGAAAFFSLSLEDQLYYRFAWTYHDFVEVRSSPGVYLTSVLVRDGSDQSSSHLETRISFDQGGEWQALSYAGARPAGACKDCGLNIHLLSSQYTLAQSGIAIQRPLHPDSAPGLIVALGSFGKISRTSCKLFNPKLSISDSYLVVSADGGRTWRIPKGISKPGAYYFSILDYGNVILVVQAQQLNPQLWVSHDRGDNFFCKSIDATEFIAHGFVPVQNPSDQKAAIIGQDSPNNTQVHWKVAIVDVTQYLSRPCVEEVDYVVVPLEKKCVLGQVIKYNLTRKDRQCYNTDGYSPKPLHNPEWICNCSQFDDFECAYGYHRTTQNRDCVQMQNLDSSLDMDKLCPTGETTFQKPSTFIRIPGDVCRDGQGLLTTTATSCTGHEKQSGLGWADVSHFLTHTSGGVAILVIIVLLTTMVTALIIGFMIKKWGCKNNGSALPVKYTRVPVEEPASGDEQEQEQKKEAGEDRPSRVRGFDIDPDDPFLSP